MTVDHRDNTEPVPPATQLLMLPFAAAIAGALAPYAGPELRVAVHRRIDRTGKIFLQQACDYVGMGTGGVGRLFAVDRGIIGMAAAEQKVARTRAYDDVDAFLADLTLDMQATQDGDDPNRKHKSYLAVPFLHQRDAVLILYADSSKLNLFADDRRVEFVVDMCAGFAQVLDKLGRNVNATIRNFPYENIADAHPEPAGTMGVYERVQECLASPSPPVLSNIQSVNWDVAAA